MENIFLLTRDTFAEKGFDVVPLEGKRPFHNNWVNIDFSKMISTRLNNKNIGIKTGKHSGVICIDIDTKDPVIRAKIDALLPPCYSGKTGDKEKGYNYFFQYNGEENEKIGGIVELLSTGNQTVVPPSIHPEKNYPYEWHGQPLTEITMDDLPVLDPNFMLEIRKLVNVKDNKIELIKGQGRCVHGSHNKLSAMLSAKIHEHFTPEQVVKELIEYDSKINEDISYFLCPSRKWRNSSKQFNAYKFTLEGFGRHLKNGEISNVSLIPANRLQIISDPIEVIEQEPIVAADYKANKQRHFRGIAQDIFKHIYANSRVPRSQFAFASTLSCMSTVLGNKLQYQGTFPNLYLMILGKSGSGKDFPLKFPYKLFAKSGLNDLVGEGSPSSHTSLIHNLGVNKVRLDAIDEASFLFRGMNAKESFTSKMAEIYQTLYTSTGDYFAGVTATTHKTKDNPSGRLGECTNPYINLLCAMTPTDFSETFTTRLMEKGLGGRFMYFVDMETKLIEWKDSTPIPSHIIEYMNSMKPSTPFTNNDGTYNLSDDIMNIRITPKSQEYLNEIRLELDKESKKEGINEKIAPILNRKAQLLTKLAMIDACSTQWDKPLNEITLGKDSIDWGLETVNINSDNMELFINDHLSGGKQERMINLIKTVLKEHGGKISKTDLGRKTILSRTIPMSQDRNIYLKSMEEDGIISFIKSGTNNNTTYVILK